MSIDPCLRRRMAAVLLAGALCAGVLTGCSGGGSATSGAGSSQTGSSSSGSAAGSGSASGSGSVSGSASASQPASSEPPAVPAYDFSQPAPESEPVENDYFADAVFMGDSRTQGFYIYSGVNNGDLLGSTGLSVFQLADKKCVTVGEQEYTLLEALALKQYKKVYFSLGVNELGYDNDQGFYECYCNAIDAIRQIQPNAIIYIEGLIPLNESVVAQSGGASYLTNEHLRVYDGLMRRVAQEKQVVYLDLYNEFLDENNELPADASADGVHLRAEGYQKWLAYLKTHTVDYETLYPNGQPAGTTQQNAEGADAS